MAFHTYIAACNSNTAIYIGVTGDLQKCMAEHRSGRGPSHTATYRIRKLVYFETHQTLPAAIARERKLKRWRRAWKDALIGEYNPNWSDLVMEASFR
ncbi:GIY-YIG nuclease family protein [Phaeobacter sp. J2-8]|uniref:GIY-YIG nuclease family protein n=1 Tax=Phaeobacter sp. J2-8 TaxID=2931394 RepID=UPI001FD1535A|nr:GIY-YIG nuclease family protein [Phaeobacter sp. J2-8]MCJ7874031.1 GIY-YIG nuclease family protein [Phaeobacter sp. J2-8]